MLFLFFYTTMMLFFETGLTALLAGTGVPVGFGTGLGEQYRSSGARHTGLREWEHATPRHARTAPAVVLCGVASCRQGPPATAILWAGLFGWLWGGRAGRQPRRGRRASGQKEKGTMEAAAALHATAAACAWRGGPRPASCPAPLLRSLAKAWNWGRDENRARIRCFSEARSAHLLRPDRCLSAANTTCGTSRSSFLDLWWTAARLASTSGGTHSHGLPCWCGEPATTLIDGHRGMATGWEQA
jgi:hypothetical protein